MDKTSYMPYINMKHVIRITLVPLIFLTIKGEIQNKKWNHAIKSFKSLESGDTEYNYHIYQSEFNKTKHKSKILKYIEGDTSFANYYVPDEREDNKGIDKQNFLPNKKLQHNVQNDKQSNLTKYQDLFDKETRDKLEKSMKNLQHYKSRSNQNSSSKLRRVKENNETVGDIMDNLNDEISTEHEIIGRKDKPHDERVVVSDEGFGYMVAVVKATGGYISAGALIDDKWVLSSASEVKTMSNNIRLIRVRLGSTNYRRDGKLLPIKDLEIHPYFVNSKPNFDLALLMLAEPVRLTPKIKVIRLQMVPKELTSTHLIVTSWPEIAASPPINNTEATSPSPLVKRSRALSVRHLHHWHWEECAETLAERAADPAGLVCLDDGGQDPCLRDTGAPVVVNGVLWGVVSSWMAECNELAAAPVVANLVSAGNASSWIHSTVHGHLWPAPLLS